MNKIKIYNEEIQELVVGDVPLFPKYTTQLMNLANQNAQGTRPKVVGQMSDLIQEFKGKSVAEWVEWYSNRHPKAVNDATGRIEQMVTNLKDAIDKIDRDLIETWVEDLILYKTFVGLRFQEAILKKVATIKKTGYSLAKPEEESQGIDGYIGYTPVSIKPITYQTKSSLTEDITVEMIFYEKKKDGIVVMFDF